MRPAIKLLVGAGCAVLALPVLAIGLLALADTGALDGAIKSGFHAATHRTLGFRKLDLRLLQARPTIAFQDLDLGSPPSITPDSLARVGRGAITVRLWPLLFGRLVMTEIAVSDVDLNLVRLAPGRNNYAFGGAGLSASLHAVTRLVIDRARVSYLDPERQVTLKAQAHYDSAAGARPLTLQGGGVDHGADFTVDAHGGPLTGRDPSAPYAFDAVMHDGEARAAITGVSVKPFDFRGFDVALDASGPNLAALGYMFGVSAPNSPPFTLKAHVRREAHGLAFTGLQGRFGETDLAGAFRSDHSGPRRAFTVTLAARQLRAQDVAAFFAARPSHAVARVSAGVGATEPVGTAADHRGVDLARLRNFDAALALTAAHTTGYALPLTDLKARLSLNNGRLTLDPFDAAVASGRLALKAVVEDRPDRLVGRVDATLRGARLEALTPAAAQAVNGSVDATAHVTSTATSADALIGASAGRIAVRLQGGRLKRSQAAALAGDPLQAGWAQLTDKGGEVPLSCVRGAFDLRAGVLTPSSLQIATGEGDAAGHGTIDLGRRQVDLTFTPVSASGPPVLKAPVRIHGALMHPKAEVALGRAIGRSGLDFIGALITTPFRGGQAAPPEPCPAPG